MAGTKMQLKISPRLMQRIDEAAEYTGINRAELVRQMIDEGLTRRSARGEGTQPSRRGSAQAIAARWVAQSEGGDTFWRIQARELVAALWTWNTRRRETGLHDGRELDQLVEALRDEAQGKSTEQVLGSTLAGAQAQAGLGEDDARVLRKWAARAAKERRGILSAITAPK